MSNDLPQQFDNAVQLDQYLSSMSDEDSKNLRSQNQALTDQMEKARDIAVADQEAELGHKARPAVPGRGIPEWVRLGAYDALLKWANGQAGTCPHRPHVTRPQPVFAAAWMPGLVVCLQCKPLLDVSDDPVANATCDGCGHVCQGMPDDGILPATVFLGALGYQIGVCTSCADEMERLEREATGE